MINKIIYINKELNDLKKKHYNKKMTTINLPYNTDKDLTNLLKQYSSIVRYSYNRLLMVGQRNRSENRLNH